MDKIDEPKNSSEESINVQSIEVNETEAVPCLRETFITTAISFLQNPSVKISPLDTKKKFLLQKGLTVEEIDVAIGRNEQLTSGLGNVTNMTTRLASPHIKPYEIGHRTSFLSSTIRLVPSIGLISGLIYAFYVFYKKYIEMKLFPLKKHPYLLIDEHLKQLSITITNMQERLSNMETRFKTDILNEITKLYAPNASEMVTMNELKSEIASIKALLLNKKQFPLTPVIGASIPSWQLKSEESIVSSENENKGTGVQQDLEKVTDISTE